jgi:hypothetical protein
MDLETKNGKRARRGGGKAFRSRLEPFVDFIRALRQQRKTWQEIAGQLRAEKGLPITFQGLHQFYRRYLKRKAHGHWEDEPVLSQPIRPNGSASRPEPNKPVLAAVPAARPFRQPNPNNMNLNDPTKI